jgi:hypothetical protein
MRRPLFVAAVTLAVLAAACSGGSKPKAVPATSTRGEPSAAATAPVSTAASPTDMLGELPLQPLTLGGDVPLPAGVVVYYFNTGYGKGGGPGAFQRAYRDQAGRLHVDLLSESLKSLGPLVWVATDIERGLAAAVVCAYPLCGAGEGMSSPDSVVRLFTSSDGGASWTDRGEIPADTFVGAIAPGSVILATQPFGQAERYWFFPSGEAITPPAPGFSPANVEGIGLVWTRESRSAREVSDWSGAPIASTGMQFESLDPPSFVASANGPAFRTVQFSRNLPDATTEGASRFIMATLDEKNAPVAAYRWDGPNLRFMVLISPTQVLGNIYTQDNTNRRFPAALVDLEARIIHPIPELSPPNGSTPFVHAALVGTFARVVSGSDCLNVREMPATAALSLGCFKDGVLLRVRSQAEQTAEGVTWVAVETPDGRAGWASAEFLER